MRSAFLIVALLIAASPAGHAQVGSGVRQDFLFGGVRFPLPEGDFLIASMTTHKTRPAYLTIADVLLAQIESRKLRIGLMVSVLPSGIEAPVHARDEPCDRTDALFRSDLSLRSYHQNCLIVYRLRAEDARTDGYAWTWLAKRGVVAADDIFIVASITRFDRFNYARALYLFSPAMAGCRDKPQGAAADVDTVRFVESVIEWGKYTQRWLDETIEGRPPPSRESIIIHKCPAPMSPPRKAAG